MHFDTFIIIVVVVGIKEKIWIIKPYVYCIQAQQEADKNKKKLDKKKEADELSTLFKPVQTVSKGRINKIIM